MNLLKQNQIVELIKKKKLKNDFSNLHLGRLREQLSFNGIAEFKFNNFPFYMLNIAKDDGVVLKYLWRDEYENMSLNLWYRITRDEGFCLDVGAHTGIYPIIGSLNKKLPLTVSFEPHFLNFARLLDNLKINLLSAKHCYLAAASNQNGSLKFESSINTYHTSGGKISDKGTMTVNAMKIDNINFTKKVLAMKIDTEGHEYNVIEGAHKTIQKHKPDIIFEINQESFNSSIMMLRKFGYKFYFINEESKNFFQINEFDENLIKKEGSNCYATLKEQPTKFNTN